MKIKDILVKQVLDSRGEWTIGVGLIDFSGTEIWTTIPAGKSVGQKEAVVVSFETATNNLNGLKESLVGMEIGTILQVDQLIEHLDPTSRKEKIGGNVSLAISICVAKFLSAEQSLSLDQLIRNEFFLDEGETYRPPKIFANLINGGLHAHNNLDFQEYLVVTDNLRPLQVAVDDVIKLWHVLGETLTSKSETLLLGDEGGYSRNFRDNGEPLEILNELLQTNGMAKNFQLGIDAASGSMWKEGKYSFNGKLITSDELFEVYKSYIAKFGNLFSLEDPFSENDFTSFDKFKQAGIKNVIIGDDLTSTNVDLIAQYGQNLSGVIIKPNQIGTLTRTCEAIKLAKKMGLFVLVSHRSAETDESFIIDLARAANADGVKIGSPVRERNIKYDRLLELYS